MSGAVGSPAPRDDGAAKVTGAARYAADWREPGLVHGVIVPSSIAAGRIARIDTGAARRVPGVLAVLSHENAPSLSSRAPKQPPSLGDPKVPLQDDEVRYHGQPVALAVAETLEAAEQAARLVDVIYRPSDAVLGFMQRRGSARIVRTDAVGRPATEGKGDLDRQLAAAAKVIRRTYLLPIENHHPMEPSATLAKWDGDHLTVWDASQGVAGVAKVLAGIFGLEPGQVHAITKFVGGGFGCKGSVWSHVVLAALAARALDRPVRVAVSRAGMATGVGYRAPTVQEVVLGCDAGGKLLAIGHETVNPTAIHKDYPEPTGNLFKVLYDAPAIATTQRLLSLNWPCPTFMRAPGEASGSFALESAMDEMAHELGLDPIALRLLNHAERDPLKDLPFSSKSLRQCYAEGVRHAGWERRHAKPGGFRSGDWLVGMGMASSSYPVHVFPAKARITLAADGTARVVSATQDIGTGTYTVMRQLAADALALDYAKVSFDLGDSEYPPAGVSGGSSTVSSVGWAIDAAAKQVLARLKRLAAADPASPCHGLDPDTLGATAGRIHDPADPDRGEDYAGLLRRHGLDSLVGDGALDEQEQKANAKRFSQHAFGAQFAEVRVHALTGEVEVVRMVGAFAAGRIVNPRTARSQYMGGMVFAIGMALTEANVADERDGRFMNRDLAEYHVPVNRDVPDLDIVMVPEEDAVVNPAGTKGIGEIGAVGGAAAIANAVFNATGVRVRELPITPDRLVAALRDA